MTTEQDQGGVSGGSKILIFSAGYPDLQSDRNTSEFVVPEIRLGIMALGPEVPETRISAFTASFRILRMAMVLARAFPSLPARLICLPTSRS